MVPGDLTTLASVKDYLGAKTAGDDGILARLITSQSRLIQSALNRRFLSQPYTEVRDGPGVGRGRFELMLNNFPVSAITSLTVNGTVIAASPDGGVLQPGYGFDSDSLWISPVGAPANSYGAAGMSKGRANVTVKYVAGFLVMPTLTLSNEDAGLLPAEQVSVPAAAPFTVTTLLTWLGDNSVAYASSGALLSKVASNPSAGQYSVAGGVYTFNTADQGAALLLSYSYVPADIEGACVELIGMRYKEKDRIGEVSRAVGQQTTTYSLKDMPASVATTLYQYRKVYAF